MQIDVMRHGLRHETIANSALLWVSLLVPGWRRKIAFVARFGLAQSREAIAELSRWEAQA